MPQQGRNISPNLRSSAQDGGTPCPSPNIPFPDQLRGGRAPEVLRAGPADAALRAHRGGQPRLVPPGGVRDPRPRLRPQVREVSRGDEDEDGWNRRPLQTLWCPSGRWQFKSEGADVGFGVYLKTKVGERQRAGDMAEVFPTQRYNAHMVPEDGSLTCSTPGICESGPNPTPKTPSPGVLTTSPPSSRRRPALRQHLQLHPRQAGELHGGGAAARRRLGPADPAARRREAGPGTPRPQPLTPAARPRPREGRRKERGRDPAAQGCGGAACGAAGPSVPYVWGRRGWWGGGSKGMDTHRALGWFLALGPMARPRWP